MGLRVHHSNLCSEITLPTNEGRTAVCCLSSVNLEEYDEWKNDKNFIPDLIRMLDNVISYFVENAPAQLEKAKFSAERKKSWIRCNGFSCLSYKEIMFRLKVLWQKANKMMFEHIKGGKKCKQKLCVERGPCHDGYHGCAKCSSFGCGSQC